MNIIIICLQMLKDLVKFQKLINSKNNRIRSYIFLTKALIKRVASTIMQISR